MLVHSIYTILHTPYTVHTTYVHPTYTQITTSNNLFNIPNDDGDTGHGEE